MIGTFISWTDRKNSPGYIIAENGCHLWIGAVNNMGYPKAGAGIRNGQRVTQLVHRIRYEREVGPIPEGMTLDHFVCNNPQCCNPRHVRPATQRENILRGDTLPARNRAKTHCPKGHPLSGDNLSRCYAKIGRRACRTCINARVRARAARKRESLS